LITAFGVQGDIVYFLRRALADSSKKAYWRAWKRSVEWASERLVQPLPFGQHGRRQLPGLPRHVIGQPALGAMFVSAANIVHAALNLALPCFWRRGG